jgi:3-phosphoshikimate 1-carboxyvinyltransferase
MGNAGTAMRPLTAALAVLGGDFSLSGVARMHERPIGDLVDALVRFIDMRRRRARVAGGRVPAHLTATHPAATPHRPSTPASTPAMPAAAA